MTRIRMSPAAVAVASCAALAVASTQARGQDLTKPPTLGPPPSVTLPPIVTRQLPNGLKLMIVEHHELPVADFILAVRTGGEADPKDQGGLASMTAAMLPEGTTTRTSLAIDDQSAYLGVDLSARSGWDVSEVALHTTTAQLDSALALFADVALRPSFPDSELTRLKRERLTSLIQLRDRGPAIADRAFASIVYGPNHPYGHPLSGTEASVGAITRAAVQHFYETYYRPNNATLIIVGDVHADAVERQIAALFGRWQRGSVPSVTYSAPPAIPATTIYLIDKPDAPQSSFRLGSVGVARSTADFFPIEVMDNILGGSFTSRLNQNLRETHGYTYGAFSGFAMRRSAGPFVAQAEVVAAKSDSALIEFMLELKAIRDTVPAPELEKSKRYLELQLPGAFESTGGIARQLIPVAIYDLPLDFYNGYVAHIEAVSQADVQRVAQAYIDPAHMDVVIVGDRKVIEPGIRQTGIAPVEIRGLNGEPVQP